MSASNIVPYYSSSPPPLDEDDDTAHSLDDNDDEFGDFSSAPTPTKASANESICFRPISKDLQPNPVNDDHFAGEYQRDEPSRISVAKNEPVRFSPVFTNDQFAKDDFFQDGDDELHGIFTGKGQDAISKNAADESKISTELNFQKQTNELDAKNFETNSDSFNSANSGGEFGSDSENPVNNEEFENPVEHFVRADECSVTGLASVDSVDTMVPDVLKDPIKESLDLSSVEDNKKQDVVLSAEDEFDDFEAFQDESASKDNHLASAVSEPAGGSAETSGNEDQDNFAVGDQNEEHNIKITNNSEKPTVDAVEFDDFEYFQDGLDVRPDSAVNRTTSADVEISPEKVQDDVTSDAPNNDSEADAEDDFEEYESAQDLHNTEEYENAQDLHNTEEYENAQDLHNTEQQSVTKDNQLNSVVSKADSSDGEISHKPGDDDVAADTSSDNISEFRENRAAKESTEEIPVKSDKGNGIEASDSKVVQFRESDERTLSSPADDKQNKNSDFDEFDDFQFADDEDMNQPSAATVHSVDSSAATIVKTDDTNSSWSAFGKKSPSDETSEDSWATFNADTNLSSDLVKNEKQVTASTVEELKTPAVDGKEGSVISTVGGSQERFKTLTSRFLTNCYPMVKETDTMQPLQLLLDIISQTQEPLSLQAPNTDAATGENKSCPRDVCVWNNLKMMDLTSAFSFQWPASSISRSLLSAINVDLSSILVGHKKSQAPLFAGNLGLLEPMKAPTELQIAQAADKDPLSFTFSDSSSSSSAAVSSALSPQDVPQLEFDWGGSGLTNPLDATEKERELLDALEPPASESSMKMAPMSLETMLATLLPSIPSTQRIPKSQQKDVDRKHLSEEAIQVLSKLPDLSFMQAKVLMFPLKDIASN